MIRYEGFRKVYGGRVVAVEGLDLAVEAGATLAFIGPNGSGKTTTLKAALGLVRPTAGRVRVAGLDVERDGRAARARVGYLPQRLSFPEGLTAREVVSHFAGLRAPRGAGAPDLLERVGLARAADRPVEGFSGGMRQRLGLAVALLGDPDLLILDEPTAALDPTGALMVRDLIRDIQREGRTVLVSSHDLAEVAVLADRIAVFDGGRLVCEGSPARLAEELGVGSGAIEDIYRRAVGVAPRLVA